MKLGIVKGRVVLNRMAPSMDDARYLIVEPVTATNLKARNGEGGGRELVVADHLGPRTGQLVGYVEGREGNNPWFPGKAPIDAYLSLVVERYDYTPPEKE